LPSALYLRSQAAAILSALMIAGAGAAYLNRGLLSWEFAFCTMITDFAYWGLKDSRLIGIGWLLHRMG
jgi:Family of unknown function (DUF6010)